MATATKRKSTNGSDPAAPSMAPITLERLKRETIEIPIIGVTPVIPHKWSEKSKRMMLDSQQGKARQKKAPKDPAQEAHDATYWLDDGRPGLPATAFKAAIANAARYYDGITITQLKEQVFVWGDDDERALVAIDGEITMREDTPRNATGVADLRYRNQIFPWKAVLTVEYVSTALTAEAVVTLLDAGGNGGVGDWRPSSPKSKTGTFGQFRVDGI